MLVENQNSSHSLTSPSDMPGSRPGRASSATVMTRAAFLAANRYSAGVVKFVRPAILIFGNNLCLAAHCFPRNSWISFVVALALIGVIAWLVHLFTLGQQTRLSVIETVDSRQRILLVRRDNVRHLILIGGTTDLVIEANIVRARGAMRHETPLQPAEPGWPTPAASRAARPPPSDGAVYRRGSIVAPSSDCFCGF